jgi:Fe2+ transport system protein FeoA
MNQRRRMGQWGRRFFGRKRRFECQMGDCLPMSELAEGTKATVYCNNDLRTIERGIYLGAKVTIFRNEIEEPNLIIAVGDSRYVLDRRIAQNIRVRVDSAE